jgi:hydrogenase maturation protease
MFHWRFPVINPNSEVRKDLRKWFSNAKRVVVAGIGNPNRMDDYVGVRVVQDLQGGVSEKVYLIECETVPENFIPQIIDFSPTHVLLIDAALQGSKPGTFELVEPERLTVSPAFSTHMLPLRIFCEHLRETTKAKIGLLLVEPQRSDFGEGLTPSVQASMKEIVHALVEVLPR